MDPSIPTPKAPPKEKKAFTKKQDKSYVSAQAGPEGAAERANKTLGVSPRAPEFTPFEATLAYAFRAIGGKATAIEGARLLSDQDAFKRIVFAWDNLSAHDRTEIRLEDLCAAAEITPEFFLSQVVPAMWKRNVDIGKLVGGAAVVPVVEAVAARAQGAFGMPDAKMILDMNGMLPTSKGISIAIDNSRKTVNVKQGPSSLPSFEESISGTTHAIRGDESVTQIGTRKAIAAPEIILEAEPIEAEVINVPSSDDSEESPDTLGRLNQELAV